jgi:uncharacterized protein (TIGR03663 family)
MDTAPLPPAPAPIGRPDAVSDEIFSLTLRWRKGSIPWVRIGIVALAAFLRLYALELRPPHFDEGVNGWFLDQMAKTGYYKYDPTNYHGPLHFYVLFLFRCLFGRHVWALRLPVVLVGILTVDWVFRFARFFDRRICAWAALAMAISPGFLYYQRDAIHETWLVFFLVLMFWGLFGLWQDGGRRYLWATGLALSGMVLTKETYVIHLGALWCALIAVLLLERVWPSRVPVLAAAEAPAPVAAGKTYLLPSPTPLFAPVAPQRWSALDLAAVLVVSLGAILLLYSGTGFNWEGINGLVTAFKPWMHKADVGEGHNKPWFYWLEALGRNEPWAAFGLIACWRWFFPRTSDWRMRLLAIYALVTFAAYSAIHYKTPWCLLSFAWPFLFLAGAAVVEIGDTWSGRAGRWTAWGLAAVLSIVSAVIAIQLNYFQPTDETGGVFVRYADSARAYADRHPATGRVLVKVIDWFAKEDYVYVQTFPDAYRIVDPLLELARENSANYNLTGTILCGSTYPLPWLLGDFHDIGYYSDHLNPPNYDADFLLVTQSRVAQAEARMKVPYFRETVRLRSSLDPLNLYLKASLFSHLFAGRTPEFQPTPPPPPLPGHDVLPQ